MLKFFSKPRESEAERDERIRKHCQETGETWLKVRTTNFLGKRRVRWIPQRKYDGWSKILDEAYRIQPVEEESEQPALLAEFKQHPPVPEPRPRRHPPRRPPARPARRQFRKVAASS